MPSSARSTSSPAAGVASARTCNAGLQDGKHVHTSAEEYDAGSDKWSLLAAQLPCERKYHSACELNGKASPLMHLSCRTMSRWSCLYAAVPITSPHQPITILAVQW